MSDIVLQPPTGFISYPDFSYTIRTQNATLTPAQFTALVTYEDHGTDTLAEPTPVDTEPYIPASEIVTNIVNIESDIMSPVCSVGSINLVTFGTYHRLAALIPLDTKARLGLNGYLYMQPPAGVKHYDPDKARIFAEQFVKLGNSGDQLYRADPLLWTKKIAFVLKGVQTQMIRQQMVITGFKSNLRNLANDVANWPILPFLIDLCTLPVVDLVPWMALHRDILLTMFTVVTSSVCNVIRAQRAPNGTVFILQDIGYNSMRTSSRTTSITYDLSRHYYVAKLLQIILNIVRTRAVPILSQQAAIVDREILVSKNNDILDLARRDDKIMNDRALHQYARELLQMINALEAENISDKNAMAITMLTSRFMTIDQKLGNSNKNYAYEFYDSDIDTESRTTVSEAYVSEEDDE
jgi:hypothetical protein